MIYTVELELEFLKLSWVWDVKKENLPCKIAKTTNLTLHNKTIL